MMVQPFAKASTRQALAFALRSAHHQTMMDAHQARKIAQHYLPSRWHYHYSQAKLRSDPLYDGVCQALADNHAPLLDLGCGIGLLAHCLRLREIATVYRGADSDVNKIALAQRAARQAQLSSCEFTVVDLAQHFPDHQGSVVVLDVLHYLYPQAQTQLLKHCLKALSPTGVLVIRTGLNDGSWRARFTHFVDWLGRGVRWMNTHPKHYPIAAELAALFTHEQVHASFTPLRGRTPFNNWLIVVRRLPDSAG